MSALSAGATSNHRLMIQAMDLKKSLEKSVKSDDSSSAGYVLDQLVALEKLNLTAEVITDSKLGKVLLNVKKKFTDVSDDVCNKAKDIMVEWKRTIESHKERGAAISSPSPAVAAVSSQGRGPSSASSSSSSGGHKTEATPPPAAPAAAAASSTIASSKQPNISLSLDSDSLLVFASLPEPRKKVISLLASHIKLSGTAAAETIAFKIESAINDAISFDLENKSYMAKVRTLAFNIKQNESLRSDIVSGELSPELLVTLSPEDMATEKMRKARQTASQAERDSRRTDWLEDNKDKIKEKLGLDPTNVWEYSEEELSDPD